MAKEKGNEKEKEWKRKGKTTELFESKSALEIIVH